ncbi:hypothetical protein [Sphingomonas sp. CLY1604]|uniref:hypothetical protein n=1 Tax=Sphingomonas sp. CLY1604 TaxID=3457786 RepID=UPI003FD8C084
MRDDRAAAYAGGAAALLFVASLAIFWPGYLQYDSLVQYQQALSGTYDDWHPPIMAHLWSLFGPSGQGPMAVLQLGGYWLGFGALAAALAASGRGRAAALLIGVAVWPPLLGWQPVVLKDTQMLGALLAGLGLIGWWRLRGRRVPRAVWSLVALLFGYAMLVRANAVFAVVPLCVMLLRRRGGMPSLRQAGVGAGATLVAILAVIALASPINHDLFAAARSGVERTQPIYDLAGIAVRSGDPAIGIPAPAISRLAARTCVRPYFWDPLGEPTRCEAEVAPLREAPPGVLYGRLALAAVRHPWSYAAHRLAHLNSTWRWLVPYRWPGAAPPEANEPNRLGLAAPGGAALAWQRLATLLVETPLGWPVLWVVLALVALPRALRGSDPASRLAAALLVSALALEMSFGVLSIASDLRYHLWPMAATAIGWIMLGRWRVPRAGLAAVALVVLAGGTARLLLPAPPQTYRGMLG